MILACSVIFVSIGCQCGDTSSRDSGGGAGGGSSTGGGSGGGSPSDGGQGGGGGTLADAGTADSGAKDAGSPDAGSPDAGSTGPIDGGTGCEGLPADACRAKPGCRADFCQGCACAFSYQGCHLVGSRPPFCPLAPCMVDPTCCASNADCLANTTCVDPESPPSCGGTCNNDPPTCTNDAQCSVTGGPLAAICAVRNCACSGQLDCAPGCSEMNPCHTGIACNATTHRCEVVACATDVECPSTFRCGRSLSCVRKTCSGDAECGSGFCVNGLCFDGKGRCDANMR